MKFRELTYKVIALVMAATIVVGCGGAESRKAKYLEKGKTYIEQKNYDKAAIELKNALQIDPKFVEAHYLMGVVEEERQNLRNAFGSYSKTIELDPNHMEAHAKLGRFYLMSGKTDEATKMAEAILASQPGNVAGRTLKAAIMARMNDTDGAIKELTSIISEDPAQADAAALLASVYLKQKNPGMALDVLTKGIEVNPKSITLRMMLINVYAQDKKNIDKIESVFHEIISLDPDNISYRTSLASLYAQTNQLEKAEKTLRDAIQAKPEDTDRYLLLSEFLISRKSISAAEAELQSAIKSYPKAYNLHFGLAKIYEAMEAHDKVAQVYRAVIDTGGSDKQTLHARNKLAELVLKQGQRTEAQRLTEEVLKENPNNSDALINRARLALLKKDPEGAITALRQVLRDQPDSVDANILLANAHLQKNETELARDVLLKSVESNPKSVQARLAYARYLAQNKDIDGALKYTAQALKQAPNDLDILTARVELFAIKRDLKSMQATITDIRAKHPDKPVGYYQMGQYHLSQKRYDEAVREYEVALGKSTPRETYQVLSAIVSVRLAQGKPDMAIKRLKDVLQENPSHPFAHELLAEVHISRKDYSEAEMSLKEAINNNPKWNIPYRNLANLNFVRGNPAGAMEVYRMGLEKIPDDPQLMFYLAELYERSGKIDDAVSLYEDILKKHPDSDIAANNLAALLVDHKTDSASYKRARELVVRFESVSEPILRDTLGWVYFKNGETDKAVAVLKDVVAKAPNVPVFQYHLGMAYHKQGSVEAARTHLSKAVTSKSEFKGKAEAQETLGKIQ